MNKEKIIHMFQWKVEDIISNLYKIKECGWSSILITPVQPSKEENNGLWYMRYQVTGLTIGNVYCSKEDLKTLCSKAHELGIKIYVDIIITHFGNKGGGNDSLIVHDDVDEAIANNSHFWRMKEYINYNSRYSITHHCNGLPSIKTENYDYQNLVIDFINELIDCEIDGVRLDSAKMIATPDEDFGEVRNMFFKRVFSEIKKPLYVFGEVIFEKKSVIDMYERYIDVLTEFNENSYNINREKTILFIESHDSYLSKEINYSSKWDMNKILNQYEYLVKDFQKVLFYARPMNDAWSSDRVKEINWRYK